MSAYILRFKVSPTVFNILLSVVLVQAILNQRRSTAKRRKLISHRLRTQRIYRLGQKMSCFGELHASTISFSFHFFLKKKKI